MKLSESTNDITSTIKDAQSATIKVCPTAFKILSSQIYNDKISAIIRELSCNAVDSHVAAGNKNPITIHLPTRMEPNFKVQDNGTGIPHDKLVEISMTYFGSTKQDTNDVIGGLGIGGKSPLSYTDQFTITSVYNGVKSSYVIFFNEQNVPDVARLSESKTDEGNGVTVDVPVKENDIYEFKEKAKNIFKWFEQAPIIKGNVVDIETPTPVHTSELFSLYCQRDLLKNSVIMGGVVYAVEDDAFKTESGLIKEIIGIDRIMIPFEIGELEVSASREGLSMTFDTKEKIKKRLVDIEEAAIAGIQKKIDALDHVYKIFDVADMSPTEKRIICEKPQMFTFGGVPLNDKRFAFSINDIGIEEEEVQKLQIFEMFRHYRKVNPELNAFPIKNTVYGKTRLFAAHKQRIHILFVDQKKHLAYNRRVMVESDRKQDFISDVFFSVATEEGLKFMKDLFKEFDVHVEKLSDRVNNGCKPEPRVSSERQYGHYRSIYKFKDGEVDTIEEPKKVSLKEIYGLIGEGVYFIIEDFRSQRAERELVKLKRYIDEGTTVVAVNSSIFGKVVGRGGVPIRDYELSDVNKKEIERVARLNKAMRNGTFVKFITDLHSSLKYSAFDVKVSDLFPDFDDSILGGSTTIPQNESVRSYYDLVFETIEPIDVSFVKKFKEAFDFFYPDRAVWNVIDDIFCGLGEKEAIIMLTSLTDAHKMIADKIKKHEDS